MAELLAKALAQLAVGEGPNEVTEFLRGGGLVPITKEEGGFRPLTLSNVVRRASLKSLLTQRNDIVSRAVGHLQYGISRKSGVDALHKSLQTRLATFPDSAVVIINFRAAFQNIRRPKACEAVARHAPTLEKACRSWYDGRAVHVIREDGGTHHEIAAGCGVDQGCPLGAFMFAVTMREPAEKVLEYARTLDSNAAFYMYLDACYIIAKPEVMEHILQYLQSVFAEIGLEINPTKTKAWCARPAELPPKHENIETCTSCAG
jgi:hypothetical protein